MFEKDQQLAAAEIEISNAELEQQKQAGALAPVAVKQKKYTSSRYGQAHKTIDN